MTLFATFAGSKSRMHLRSYITAVLLLLATALNGQSKLVQNVLKDIELFAGVGSTLYFGDVGGKDSKITGTRMLFDNLDIDLWQARPMASFGVRINPMKNIALSVQFSPMLISGNDLRSNYASRGYAFKTRIYEIAVIPEFYFADRITGYAPYVIAGFSGFFYSFKNNVSVNASKWYSGNSVILGIGTRFPSETRYFQSLDAAFHFTSTDFLDGFKTEKNSSDIFFVLCYKIHFQTYSSWYYDHRGLVR